jgi:hypothetical protein
VCVISSLKDEVCNEKAAVLSILVVVVLLALEVIADAQQPAKISRIGFLSAASASAAAGIQILLTAVVMIAPSSTTFQVLELSCGAPGEIRTPTSVDSSRLVHWFVHSPLRCHY